MFMSKFKSLFLFSTIVLMGIVNMGIWGKEVIPSDDPNSSASGSALDSQSLNNALDSSTSVPAPGAVVNVNFGVKVVPSLFKKFAMFNSGLVPMLRYRRDKGLINELKPESLRIDLSIGKSIGE